MLRKYYSVAAIALALFTVSSYAHEGHDDDDDDAGDSDVIVQKDDTFRSFIKDNKYVLAEFYAPWCGHCKALAPHYENAASALKNMKLGGHTVKLVKVDATAETEIAKEYAVQGYPTLYWFVDGVKTEYDGGRTNETIVEWIVDMTSPAVRTISESEMKNLNPSTKPFAVLQGPELLPSFSKTADGNRKVMQFYYVKTSGSPSVTIQHNHEEPIKVPENVFKNADDLQKLVQKHSFPLFGPLDGETYSRYTSLGKGIVWFLPKIDSSDELDDEVNKHRKMFTAIADKYKDKYSVIHIDTVKFKGAMEGMLGVSEFPAVAVHKTAGDKKKYIYKGDITQSKIEDFIAGVEKGTVQPTLKSEPIPSPNSDPVRVIVGSTIEKEVFTKDKDVLFEIYAPWCGHCKKLTPEFEKVAKKVRKEGLEDIITIAKMDGTTNDSPVDTISWDGFPTLYYVKAGSSKPQKYDGERNAKKMWKWIKDNHSKKDDLSRRLSDKEGKDEAKEAGKEEL